MLRTSFVCIYRNMEFSEVYSVNKFLSKVRLFIVYNMLMIDKKYWMLILYYYAIPITKQINDIKPYHSYYIQGKSII